MARYHTEFLVDSRTLGSSEQRYITPFSLVTLNVKYGLPEIDADCLSQGVQTYLPWSWNVVPLCGS